MERAAKSAPACSAALFVAGQLILGPSPDLRPGPAPRAEVRGAFLLRRANLLFSLVHPHAAAHPAGASLSRLSSFSSIKLLGRGRDPPWRTPELIRSAPAGACCSDPARLPCCPAPGANRRAGLCWSSLVRVICFRRFFQFLHHFLYRLNLAWQLVLFLRLPGPGHLSLGMQRAVPSVLARPHLRPPRRAVVLGELTLGLEQPDCNE
jgi:hypothetical protein